MAFNLDELAGAYDYDDDVMGDVMGAAFPKLRRSGGEGGMNPAMMGKLLRAVKAGHNVSLPPKPEWRDALAPGVNAPSYGTWPLPLNPQANDGVLDNATNQIEWQGTPQRPFRGERIVIVINRSAAAFNQVRIASLTVGTTPQLADIGELAAEAFGPNAFGVRLKLDQATPGVIIRLLMRAVGTVPVGETIALAPQIMGSVVQ